MEDLFDIIIGIFTGEATYIRSILVIVAGILLMVFSPFGIVTWILGAFMVLLGIIFLIISLVVDSNKKGK